MNLFAQNFKRNLLAASILLSLGLSAPLVAQDTSSSIRGRISTADGSASANATVAIEDTRAGATRTLTSNSAGVFYARISARL